MRQIAKTLNKAFGYLLITVILSVMITFWIVDTIEQWIYAYDLLEEFFS